MTGAERGFLLLGSPLGNPDRRPLTTAQLRKLAHRVREAEKIRENRDLEPRDLIRLGYGAQEAEHIIHLLSEDALLDRYLSKACKLGCIPLTWPDHRYPTALKQALGDDAPAVLWARGDLELIKKPGIALVGSRDLKEENRRFSAAVGKSAAAQDLILISGNARGADRTAQDAALAAGGRVISIVADRLSDHVPVAGQLFLSEGGFDLDFSPQRALSRNRCIHGLGISAIAAQCSLRTGGTWDGSVRNLRFGWSPLYVFDDSSESTGLLEQMGAVLISFEDLKDLRNLPRQSQFTL